MPSGSFNAGIENFSGKAKITGVRTFEKVTHKTPKFTIEKLTKKELKRTEEFEELETKSALQAPISVEAE